MGLRVLGARIVVLEDKLDKETNAGIIIPGREKEPTYQGTVIAVGNGAMIDDGTRVPVDMNIGDRVVYSSFTGSPVHDKEDKETYIILNERDVLAVFTDKNIIEDAVKKACDDYMITSDFAEQTIPEKIMEAIKRLPKRVMEIIKGGE